MYYRVPTVLYSTAGNFWSGSVKKPSEKLILKHLIVILVVFLVRKEALFAYLIWCKMGCSVS